MEQKFSTNYRHLAYDWVLKRTPVKTSFTFPARKGAQFRVPFGQTLWVCSQVGKAPTQPWAVSWLGHEASLSPCSFLDSCFRIDLNSPCLQVDHINTGLSWRLPELSWNCDTQRVSRPQDWKVGCLRSWTAPENPFCFTTKESLRMCVCSGTPASGSEMNSLEKDVSSPVGSLKVIFTPPLSELPSSPCPLGPLGFFMGSFSEERFYCLSFYFRERAPHSLLIWSLLLTSSSCPHLSQASLSFPSSPSLEKSLGNGILPLTFFVLILSKKEPPHDVLSSNHFCLSLWDPYFSYWCFNSLNFVSEKESKLCDF